METKKVMKCDVAVVGGGNAGLCAAIEAANLGVSVLLLEKAPKNRRGGNSRFTGGVWRFAFEKGEDVAQLVKPEALPVPLENIDFEPYTKDAFYADAMRVSQGLAEKYWTEVLVDQSLSTMVWLTEQGVKWELSSMSIIRHGDHIVMPVGDIVLQNINLGEGLVEMLYGIAESRKIPILYETAAQSLVVNADGNVCGVIAKSNEGMIKIEARGGVILACGGFEGSP